MKTYKLPIAELTGNQYAALFLGLGKILAGTLDKHGGDVDWTGVVEVAELAKAMQATYDRIYSEAIEEIKDHMTKENLAAMFNNPTKKERAH